MKWGALSLMHVISPLCELLWPHYNDVIMGALASQITSLAIVYSIVYSDADKKNQSSASLAFVRGIHRWPVNSPHKGQVTRKMFPFDDVIMPIKHIKCRSGSQLTKKLHKIVSYSFLILITFNYYFVLKYIFSKFVKSNEISRHPEC